MKSHVARAHTHLTFQLDNNKRYRARYRTSCVLTPWRQIWHCHVIANILLVHSSSPFRFNKPSIVDIKLLLLRSPSFSPKHYGVLGCGEWAVKGVAEGNANTCGLNECVFDCDSKGFTWISMYCQTSLVCLCSSIYYLVYYVPKLPIAMRCVVYLINCLCQ